MGVTGLWQVIDSVGHPIKLEGLEGKQLGVDANLWLYKFIRGFRERENAANINAHKLGLFNRISKLLFYKIKPIFVFDGPAPVLKRRTLEKRHNRRNVEYNKIQNQAVKLLAEQLKRQYPDADIDQIKIKVPELRSHNLVLAEKLTDEDRELFYLPPEEVKIKDDNGNDADDDDDSNDDDLIAEEYIFEDYGGGTSEEKIDIHSEDFKKLPAEVRYEFLTEIRDKNKRIRRAAAMPEDANDFSSFQLQRLKSKRKIQEKIEQCQKDIQINYTGEIGGQTVQSYRVQSDATSTMLYGKKESSNSLIDIDIKPVQDLKIPNKPDPITNQSEDRKRSSESLLLSVDQLNKQPKVSNIKRRGQEVKTHFLISPRNLIINKNNNNNSQDDKLSEEVHLSEESEDETEVETNGDTSIESIEICDSSITKHKNTTINIDSDDYDESLRIEKEIYANQQSKADTSAESIAEKRKSGDDKSCSEDTPPKKKVAHERPTEPTVSETQVTEITSSSSSSEAELTDLDVTIRPEPEIEEIKEDKTKKQPEKSDDEEVIFEGSQSARKIGPSIGDHTVLQIDSDSSEDFLDDTDISELLAATQASQTSVELSSQKQEPSKENEKNKDKPEGQPTQSSSQDSNEESRSQTVTVDWRSIEVDGAFEKSSRLTNKVTTRIIEEAKELLTLFGVPFIDAAGEAEAQLAYLEQSRLTEGTITDDSDVWLFGAQNVYRHFFSDNKYILQYKMSEIVFHTRLTRTNLICFAMLVGSDYTEGIMNIGPVTALDILNEFPGEDLDPLLKFKLWREQYDGSKKGKIPGSRKRELLLKYKLPEEFPSRVVFEGYMQPVTDKSTEKFEWGMPDLDDLREYARRNFGWGNKKIDEKLLPVLKKLNERKTQPTIDSFFSSTRPIVIDQTKDRLIAGTSGRGGGGRGRGHGRRGGGRR